MKLIGLTGFAHSGKDTSADFIEDILKKKGLTYSRVCFSRPLKESCKILFNLTDEELNNQDLKEEVLRNPKGEARFIINGLEASPRIILQWLGTQLRSININFFVNNMDKIISSCVEKDFIIITDVRYDNEAELVKKYFGTLVKIERNIKKINSSDHSSERGIDKSFVDFIIENNGTLDNLYELVEGFIELLSSTSQFQ